jgi:uncharacterized protein YjbI with pentapeptide repeats
MLKLTHAHFPGADLTDGNLLGSDLTDVNLNLTNLRDSIFDCDSLNIANLTINANQVHLVKSINGNLKEVSSCQ